MRCSECDQPARALGLCPAHYQRRRNGVPLDLPVVKRSKQAGRTCAAGNCPRSAKTRGLCGAHYKRLREGKDLRLPVRTENYPRECTYNDCGRPSRSKGLCSTHYSRERAGRDMDAPVRTYRGDGRLIDQHGYVYVWAPEHPQANRSGRVAEHRLVMERVIGRPLHPWETVHHKHGLRQDNRPEQLELWVRPQPYGQRVEDLVSWIVEAYPDYVRAALDGRPHLFVVPPPAEEAPSA